MSIATIYLLIKITIKSSVIFHLYLHYLLYTRIQYNLNNNTCIFVHLKSRQITIMDKFDSLCLSAIQRVKYFKWFRFNNSLIFNNSEISNFFKLFQVFYCWVMGSFHKNVLMSYYIRAFNLISKSAMPHIVTMDL